jgi:hypothetical protein
VHSAVETLGHLLALSVTAANGQERTQVEALAQQVPAVTGDTVELAYGDQGYTGDPPAADAQKHGIRLGGDPPAGGQAGLRLVASSVGR